MIDLLHDVLELFETGLEQHKLKTLSESTSCASLVDHFQRAAGGDAQLRLPFQPSGACCVAGCKVSFAISEMMDPRVPTGAVDQLVSKCASRRCSVAR